MATERIYIDKDESKSISINYGDYTGTWIGIATDDVQLILSKVSAETMRKLAFAFSVAAEDIERSNAA